MCYSFGIPKFLEVAVPTFTPCRIHDNIVETHQVGLRTGRKDRIVEAVQAKVSGEAVLMADEGLIAFATPEVAAKLQNDAEVLYYARAIANNDNNALVGKYVIWLTGENDFRFEIGSAEYHVIYGANCGFQIPLARFLDNKDTIIIANTQAEAEDRLAAMRPATVNDSV